MLTGTYTAQELAVRQMLISGATIPFIARYRKELTGGMDEIAIERIDKEYRSELEFFKRREGILRRLDEQGVLDQTLLLRIQNCSSPDELEDLYLPYRQKRESRADKARKKGLEPLAKIIMSQTCSDLTRQAFRFTNHLVNTDDALQGATDIIAEWVSESVSARNQVRNAFRRIAVLTAQVLADKEDEAANYRNFFHFSKALRSMSGHQILAVFRAEKEGFLKVKIGIDRTEWLPRLERIFIKSDGDCSVWIRKAIKDSYNRLLAPSIENEIRKEFKERADDEAIRVFANNLNQLLLAPPLGPKRILAIDPGFKSGCKVVCLDERGNLLEHDVIYPHPPQNQTRQSADVLKNLIKKHRIEAVAIGNGTAGRESENFVQKVIKDSGHVSLFMVDESGASIYSASEVGREEFPGLDLTVRGAVSIGRRLMDPLAELVKIDPKSIGVGQYQHDVAQDKLRMALENTVLFAVNKVGVDVNTASRHLLRYVSGLGPAAAANLIEYRNAIGGIRNRQELMQVKGIGARAFELAAGFIRVPNSDNPLDNSAVHPERYELIDRMAAAEGSSVNDLLHNAERCGNIDLSKYVSQEVGLPTLLDILAELIKPGRDPRRESVNIQFDERIRSIEDLHVRMVLNGRVSNLTKFGAFVDIGIKQDGLLHVSEIANRYLSDPAEVLSLNQQIRVRVVELDLERKRIGLSMRLTE